MAEKEEVIWHERECKPRLVLLAEPKLRLNSMLGLLCWNRLPRKLWVSISGGAQEWTPGQPELLGDNQPMAGGGNGGLWGIFLPKPFFVADRCSWLSVLAGRSVATGLLLLSVVLVSLAV